MTASNGYLFSFEYKMCIVETTTTKMLSELMKLTLQLKLSFNIDDNL